MFTKKTIPFIAGSIFLVAVAFLFLTRTLDWTYVSELYKDEEVVVELPSAEVVEAVKLEIAVMLEKEEYEQFLKSALRLREKMPHIHVNIINYAHEITTYEEWVTALQLGELGDIQIVNNEWVIPLALKGYHQPLDRLMNNEVLSDQFSSIVDAFRWNGYLWALPYESNPYLVLMHKHAYNQIQIINPALNLPEQVEQEAVITEAEAATEESALTEAQAAPVETALTEAQAATNALEEAGAEAPARANQLPLIREPIEMVEYNSLSRSEKLWRFTYEDWLFYYEQMNHDGALIAMDESNIASSLTLLTLWNEQLDTYFDIESFTDQQLSIIDDLITNPDLIESLHAWNPDLPSEQQPYLQVVSFRQYLERRSWYEQHYMSYEQMYPLPWLNGKSFMMSSNVNHVTEAMKWLEEMNRYQPENTLIHSKLYATFSSNAMQSSSSMILQEKLNNKQLFQLNPKVPFIFMDLKQEWTSGATLVEKWQKLYNYASKG